MNYLLGSGFYDGSEEKEVPPRLWLENLDRHTTPAPRRIVIMSVGNSRPKWHVPSRAGMDIIDLEGNLGHVHQLIGKQEPAKPHAYCGWSASVMALALIAYNAELDFVYREQSLLAFGDYVGEMYRQMGNAGVMIFGSYKQDGKHQMPCAQSLFLIRHAFIPKFVQQYLGLPDDRNITMLPEQKFARIEREQLGRVKRFNFGVDRGRPLPFDAPVWYFQKATADEMAELFRRKMI